MAVRIGRTRVSQITDLSGARPLLGFRTEIRELENLRELHASDQPMMNSVKHNQLRSSLLALLGRALCCCCDYERKSSMLRLKIAVVRICFGTVPSSSEGASGVPKSKFRDAPSVEIAASASIKDLPDAVSLKVATGGVNNVTAFSVTPDGNGDFMKSVSATYTDAPKPGRRAGTYMITDSSDSPTTPIVTALQTYHHDRNFMQKNTDGFQKGDNFTGARDFEDGDLVARRAVQIRTGPNEALTV